MVKNRLIYSLLLIVSLLQASSAQAQPVDHNYVLTSTPLDAGGGNLRLVQFANGCQTEYVYGARRYDAALPMWDKPDQRCEDYYHISPYVYCLDNLVKHIDPDGNSVWTRAAKTAYKIGKSVAKNGFSALNQTDSYLSAFTDVKENIETLFDEDASAWNRIGAGVSLASELLPVSIGDVKEVGAIARKPLKGVAEHLSDGIHGNSKSSTKAQHAYDILDRRTGLVVKTGVSGGRIRKRDGKSYRAEQQVRLWNKEEGGEYFYSKVIYQIPSGANARDKILKFERWHADEVRKDLEKSNKHLRP